MCIKNLQDLLAYYFPVWYLSCDAKADRHDFKRQNTYLPIRGTKCVMFVDLRQKLCIGVEAYANSMYEEDGETCLGGMRAVPIAEGRNWGRLASEEVCDAEGKDGECLAD